MNNVKNIFAFIFDSGRLGSYSYGDVVFKCMLEGGELSRNLTKITVSLGDIHIDQKYVDIEPYVIKDEYCTLNFDDLLKNKRFKDFPFCWIVENLSSEIAYAIDARLKESVNGYAGMSCIDKSTALEKKQFWKYMVKCFNLYGKTITSFQDPQLEELEEPFFIYSEIASQLEYKVEYTSLYDEIEGDKEDISMQNKNKKQEKDIDRDLLTLNFSIRQELQISGALLWKSINALSKIDFNVNGETDDHLIEYPFFTLYFASQGIERMQKALVELICKKNHIQENEKDKVYDLLMSHAHSKLNDWIVEKEKIELDRNCRKLIEILTRFYNTVRYARYADESCLKSITPEYDLLLEMKSSKRSDLNTDIKNTFGSSLGKLANRYYTAYYELCFELHIFAYELKYDSAACIVYDHREKNLYKEFLNRQRAKKEILYWLVKKAAEYPKYSIVKEDALDFDAESVEHYLWELIFNSEDGQDCYGEVDGLYDELCFSDKEKWKNRIEMIDYFIDR